MVNKVSEFLCSNWENDPAFQKKLNAVKTHADIVALANSKGFDFSENEFSSEIDKIKMQMDPNIIKNFIDAFEKGEDSELSPKELELISGGATPLTMALPFGYGTAVSISALFWGAVFMA